MQTLVTILIPLAVLAMIFYNIFLAPPEGWAKAMEELIDIERESKKEE